MSGLVLTPREREFVDQMRKRDRDRVVSTLNSSSRKAQRVVPLRVQVLQSSLPEDVRLDIFRALDRHDLSGKYIEWVKRAIRLPLGVLRPAPACGLDTALARAKATMDAATVGHEQAKREVLSLICRARTSARSSYAIGLEGPAGCGKTSFVRRALAPALQVPFVSIPCGGASDANFLLGSTYTYEGSKEGRIAAALVEAQCANPCIYFDEIDKVSKSDKGAEIEAVLIHLIDPTDPTLRDRYFHGIDIDVSRCTFVFSYNRPEHVNPILLDRIKRVAMSPPSADERARIVTEHMLPRAQECYESPLAWSDDAVRALLRRQAQGESMRAVEKDVEHVASSAHLCRALGPAGLGLDASVRLVDEDTDEITGDFVQRVLDARHVDASSSLPPCGMYT